MRMQLAAPWFVERIEEMAVSDRFFDVVLMSTFLDVAVFRALVTHLPGWSAQTRLYTYFHENQFGYPGILSKEKNHQFTAINFSSALASDKVAFNSRYNQETFMHHCRKYLQKAADMRLEGLLNKIEKKSSIIYPGIDFRPCDRAAKAIDDEQAPLIIWNHRWEHDKNPDHFFTTLYKLEDNGIPFRLAVMGEHAEKEPPLFAEARKRLSKQIVHFGYIEDRTYYYELLKKGDFVVSTSLHEYFGISVLEAVRAGCFPVVPDRLSYVELFEAQYRYQEHEFYNDLKDRLLVKNRLSEAASKSITDPYSWSEVRQNFSQWFDIDHFH